MTAEQVAENLFRDPFVPLKISLDTGEEIYVALRGRAVVTADRLVVGYAMNPFARPEDRRLRVIPLDRVQSIGDADVSRFPRGPRR